MILLPIRPKGIETGKDLNAMLAANVSQSDRKELKPRTDFCANWYQQPPNQTERN